MFFAVSLEDARMKKSKFLPLLVHIVLLIENSFKRQYMAVSGAGAGAEIMHKGGAGAENE